MKALPWPPRFWPHVKKSKGRGCWTWTGWTTRNGYGMISVNCRDVFVHRLIFEIYHRPLRKGEIVHHKCDNKACVRPSHLRAGTQQENLRDAVLKGLIPSTPKHIVYKIRRGFASGKYTRKELSEKYDVSFSFVCGLIRGSMWRWR